MTRKRNLLIDECPLLVLPSLAKSIGLNEAIALQQLHYWLENPKGGVEMDGFRWVYNTYEQWQEDNFPFWSVRTVIRVFANLEWMELVISKQQASYDRKKYYRVHYDNLASWNETDCHNADLQDGNMDSDKVAPSLTETTPETTQINNSIQIFERIKDILKPPETSRNTFTYLQSAQPVRFQDGILTLAVPDAMTRDWLDSRMTSVIAKTFPGILGEEAEVCFVVGEGANV